MLRACVVLVSAIALSACPVEPPEDAAPSTSAIWNGSFTSAEARPRYLVRFGSDALPHYCGGSILNEQWVLTAAHCMDEARYPSIDAEIVAGDRTRSEDEGSEVTRTISLVVMHPSFAPSTLQNDLALVKLSSPLTLGGTLMAAELPDASPLIGQWGIAYGWGNTEEGGGASDRLKHASLQVSSHAECVELYGGPGVRVPIGPNQFCAYIPEPYFTSIDRGDSGGPFASSGLSGVSSIALTSWSFPSVFVDVAKYTAWIEEVAFNSTWLKAGQDATVRAGIYANTNYGQATQGTIKNDPNTNYDQEMYFTFNLANVTSPVIDAELSLYCARNGTEDPAPQIRVRGLDAAGENWDEDELTWNNRPTSGTDLMSKTFHNPGWKRYTWKNVSLRDFVESQRGGVVSFRVSAINAASTSSMLCKTNEEDRLTQRPLLQVRTQ